ncbi:hypothetical protein DRP77_05715 [Candidatus Poribacteria bacterium]|nr:MAG: hypothetical protein DRP77_05715 [Candidatus Poribacteria bacterium]
MKAALIYGPGDVRVEEVDPPKPQPDQALIRIKACGICPTDVRAYTGLRKLAKYPSVIGHEWVGEIVEVGEEFEGFEVGDKVIADWRVVCGECYFCRRGIFNYCLNMRRERVRGGFCEYGVAIARNLRRMPESLSFEEAVFAEPLACCINGIERSNIQIGDTVVIIGAGPIGLLHVQLAKHRGARVIVSELIPERLRLAGELGADELIDASKEDPVERVKELTDGLGANAVIVAVGAPEPNRQALQMACIGGTVNYFAGTYPPSTFEFDPNLVHYKQINVTGSHDFTPHHFTAAVRLLETRTIKVKPIISHILPLERIEEGFEIVSSRKGGKVVITI